MKARGRLKVVWDAARILSASSFKEGIFWILFLTRGDNHQLVCVLLISWGRCFSPGSKPVASPSPTKRPYWKNSPLSHSSDVTSADTPTAAPLLLTSFLNKRLHHWLTSTGSLGFWVKGQKRRKHWQTVTHVCRSGGKEQLMMSQGGHSHTQSRTKHHFQHHFQQHLHRWHELTMYLRLNQMWLGSEVTERENEDLITRSLSEWCEVSL